MISRRLQSYFGCSLFSVAFLQVDILAITEREMGFGNFLTEQFYTRFFWLNLVVEFGLYLFLIVRNKVKKKSRKQNKYCCNSLQTVVNEVAMKT